MSAESVGNLKELQEGLLDCFLGVVHVTEQVKGEAERRLPLRL
jgi:hypothetical protein